MRVGIAVGQRRTAHQLVRDTLRQGILTGRIPGGTRLVQADLARTLKVSTTPVREALRELAGEGLIELDAHRGAVVHTLSRSEVDEIYRIRQLLEPEVMARAVAHITPEQLIEVERIQQDADRETDPVAWVDLNRRFHRAFSQAAGSRRLAGIVETLQDSATIYVVAALVAGTRTVNEANQEHWEIVRAVRSGDVAEAQRVTLAHIYRTLAEMPERMS